MRNIQPRAQWSARVLVSLLVALGVAACHRTVPVRPAAPAKAPARTAARLADGGDVIEAMHDRYAGKWYHTVAFRQKTTVRLPSGRELVQNWLEAIAVPGRLRIDTDVPPKGNGTLYANDSTYVFSGGKLIRATAGANELLVLGFDVYGQTPEATERILKRQKIDFGKMHETTWQGRPVYVVGAAEGDTTSKQFWVDRDRLLFVRLISPTAQGRSDVRFERYTRVGDGWIAARVEQLLDGRRRYLEEYSDIRNNPALSEALFDPRQWSTAPHWYDK